jgi:hypothetical protein
VTLTTYADLVQGTDEWLQARCGIVTASVVGKLLTPSLAVADNETSRGLTLSLVAERITGHVDETFMSADMWRGIEDEPIARDLYREHHAPVEEVGLMVRADDDWGGYRIGYSPDGLVGDEGLIECKSRLQKVHLRTILTDEIPAENMAQLQCGLLVSGRAWIDYLSYCGGMPLYVKRVHPDPSWHASIVAAVAKFESNAAAYVFRYREAVRGLPTTERVNRDAEIEF